MFCNKTSTAPRTTSCGDSALSAYVTFFVALVGKPLGFVDAFSFRPPGSSPPCSHLLTVGTQQLPEPPEPGQHPGNACITTLHMDKQHPLLVKINTLYIYCLLCCCILTCKVHILVDWGLWEPGTLVGTVISVTVQCQQSQPADSCKAPDFLVWEGSSAQLGCPAAKEKTAAPACTDR